MTARPRGKGKGVTPRPRPDDGAWRDDWNTPEPELELVRDLSAYLYPRSTGNRQILLDPCWNRTALTRPCFSFWTEAPQPFLRDGLAESWTKTCHRCEPGVVFVNPPYSELERWLAKCANEASGLADDGHSLVALVPARVEQPCWTDIVRTTSLVSFRYGRITFDHPEGERASSAPMPIALLIWSPFTDGKENRVFQGKGWWCAEVRP